MSEISKTIPTPGTSGSFHTLSAHRRGLLARFGKDSWLLLGIFAVVAAVLLGLNALSSIFVPVMVAVILGVLMQPVVYWLERHGAGPTSAATATMLIALLLLAGMVAMAVRGLIHEVPQIYKEVMVGWHDFVGWTETWDVDGVWLERIRSQVTSAAPGLGSGIFGFASSTFSGLLAFGIGAFFSLFILFYVLRDGRRFPGWVARTIGYNEEIVDEVAATTSSSLLAYFRGTALTALITGPILVIPMLILRVPLVVPIFLLYFFLSFIPYIGSFASGLFAVLIAFGSGGPMAGFVILMALLISNGVIQNAVWSWAMGTSLQLHPVTVLLATLVAGALWGLIGMTIGAPLVAAYVKSAKLIRKYEAEQEALESVDPTPEVAH